MTPQPVVAGGRGMLECVQGKVGRKASGHLPANDYAAEHVDDEPAYTNPDRVRM